MLDDSNTTNPMSQPSDHLLKIFAAVPVVDRVLDLGGGHQCHAGPLALLGFDLHVCAVSPDTVAVLREVLTGITGADEAQQRIAQVPRLDALGYPDAFFDWIVAYNVYGTDSAAPTLPDVLAETRRVLKSGGWIYVAVPVQEEEEDKVGFTPETLDQTMQRADFALAEAPAIRETGDRLLLEGIYRRVDAGTSV